MQVSEIVFVLGVEHNSTGKLSTPKNVLVEKLNAKLAELETQGKNVLSISIMQGQGPNYQTPIGAYVVVGTN